MPIDPAAQHMASALKAIYAENTTPYLERFPSGGVMLCTGEQDIFGNFAVGLVGGEWNDACAALSKIGAVSCLLAPGDRDDTFEKTVGESGFAYATSIPAMTASLGALPDVDLPAGYVFERLPASEDGGDWARALSEGYPVAICSAESMSPVHVRGDDADSAALQFFQVRVGDDVAGVSALALLDGVAGIYCVTTLAAHRQRGLGAVLTAWPLLRARELGYTTGVLQASEAGYSTYRKLGFTDTGAVQLYVRSA